MRKKSIMILGFCVLLFISGWLTGCFTSEKSLPSIYYFIAKDMGQYTVKGNLCCYDADELFDYMDSGAEKYIAYNIKNLSVQEYENGSGLSLTIEIYNMSTPADAFGIYSLNRNPNVELVNIGNEGFITAYTVEFWKANFYIKLIHSVPGPKDELLKIAKMLDKEIPKIGSEPEIVRLLPEKDCIFKSIKFFHQRISLCHVYYIPENFLELNEKTNGVVGTYKKDDNTTAKVFIIEYPSQEDAESAYNSYSEYINTQAKDDTLIRLYKNYIFGVWDGIDYEWAASLLQELSISVGDITYAGELSICSEIHKKG